MRVGFVYSPYTLTVVTSQALLASLNPGAGLDIRDHVNLRWIFQQDLEMRTMRNLTNGEIAIIKPIFKNTLLYNSIKCDINHLNLGGVDNSIAPTSVVYFSRNWYKNDFSKQHFNRKWLFVNEMTHVWQWYHRLYTGLPRAGFSYDYEIEKGRPLRRYSIEQQAAIVADYWAVTAHFPPRYNPNIHATSVDYRSLIAELQSSGAPVIRNGSPQTNYRGTLWHQNINK
jgi:hypothetical protein